MLSPLARETPDVLRIVRSHHERLDGRGFPDGLRGEKIPIEARIVAVADAFDAMTTERPYRDSRSPEEAVDELRRVAGTPARSRGGRGLRRGAFPDPGTAAAVRLESVTAPLRATPPLQLHRTAPPPPAPAEPAARPAP